MRRAFLVLWIGVLLLLALSGMGWGQPGDVPIADVLRGVYDVPVAAALTMPPTADVLRGVYNVPLAAVVAMPPTADVLRGVYDVPLAAVVAMPSTADVLRGVYNVPVAVVMAMPSTADVLRGPYMPPAVAAPATFRVDLVVAGLAVLLLLVALGLDYLRHRRPPVAGGLQPPRPGHVH